VASDADGGREIGRGVGGWRGKGANLFLIAILVARYCSYPNIEIYSPAAQWCQKVPAAKTICRGHQVHSSSDTTSNRSQQVQLMVAEINWVNRYNFQRQLIARIE
jgi:hypothetical protein